MLAGRPAEFSPRSVTLISYKRLGYRSLQRTESCGVARNRELQLHPFWFVTLILASDRRMWELMNSKIQ